VQVANLHQQDFDSLPRELLPENPNVKVLPDGRTINKHTSTTEGSRGDATLDMPNPRAKNPKTRIKIRYPEC